MAVGGTRQQLSMIVWLSHQGEASREVCRYCTLRWNPPSDPLIQVAILNGDQPYGYLKDVIDKLPTWPSRRIDELLSRRCPHAHNAAKAVAWPRTVPIGLQAMLAGQTRSLRTGLRYSFVFGDVRSYRRWPECIS